MLERIGGLRSFQQEQKQLLQFFLFYVSLHAVIVILNGGQTEWMWYLFLAFALAPSVYISFRKAFSVPHPVRLRWLLWSASLACFALGYFGDVFTAAGIAPYSIYIDGHSWAALSSSLALLVVAMPLLRDSIRSVVVIDMALALLACITAELVEFKFGHLASDCFSITQLLLTLHIVTGITAYIGRTASVIPEERDLLLKIALAEASICVGKIYLIEYWVLHLHRAESQNIWFAQDISPLLMAYVLLAPMSDDVPDRQSARILTRSTLFISMLLVQLSLSAAVYIYRPNIVIVDLGILLTLYCLRATMIHRAALTTHASMCTDLRAMTELSDIDPLTRIGNRRAFDKALTNASSTVRRTGHPLSVILIDVDHFKRINDTLGHLEGDNSLVAVATALTNAGTRVSDTICRYAGDEFAVILPDTNNESALEFARRIEASMAMANHRYDLSIQITLSIGVATCEDVYSVNGTNLVAAADHALYQAKAAGRNCIRTATSSIPLDSRLEQPDAGRTVTSYG